MRVTEPDSRPCFHRGYRIEYNPKPIPTRAHDWDWTHEDYDGPGDSRCGTSPSIEAAKVAIDECEEMREALREYRRGS